MPQSAPCFVPFKQGIEAYALPERFTFPFYYQPHALCLLAAQELQHYLGSQNQWQHNFGLGEDPNKIIGKMFGVLVVKEPDGKIGYLAAFSGKLAEQNHLEYFVPPVFDMLAEDSFYLREQSSINHLNKQITLLETSAELAHWQQTVNLLLTEQKQHIATQRALMIEQRQKRKAQREMATLSLTSTPLAQLNAALNQQSIHDKLTLRELSVHWDNKVAPPRQKLAVLSEQLLGLKARRKAESAALQQRLFSQYRFLNIKQQERDLQDIFSHTALRTPPAGAGECCAPKLLQYAFKHQLKPVALGEFWWGASPKSEVRKHQQFYPACLGKCQPILAHMLDGMAVDDNPMLNDPADILSLDIVYQDDVMLVVNKPAELLSVPGKNKHDCVYARIKNQFPSATGPIIVHRLDMATSGLMVIALNQKAHKSLQKQFIQRVVKKCYVAIIDGLPEQDKGTISLPLRGDLYDRPRQLVCEEHGKTAQTSWQVISRDQERQQSKVYLYPYTGRTHQLRVHCAHTLGLDMPIVGDDLYGKGAHRLHLHAQRLSLQHPLTQETMHFEVEAEF
ncbi:MAG: tRNA pseudouridine32 synthase/23S rRNA pseudouridine746 synthase [Paraglaciecola sp.]|jgi:tRNA pseudouridine32 synthase/23S rRNA pseudouridine746 synthase